jgi:GTP pyrophosphokinase
MTEENFRNLAFQRERLLEFIEHRQLPTRQMLLEALKIAEEAHGNQQRDEGGMYIIHPVRCARALITEFGISDPELIAALLLHDVVEDTPITLADLRKTFSERTVELVDDLTRRRPPDETEEQKFDAKAKKFEKLMKADYDTRLLKCMDVLDNYRSWRLIPSNVQMQKKITRWAIESEQFVLPLAEKTDQRVAKALRKAIENYKKLKT